MKNTYVIIVMLIGFFLALITMSAHAATCNVTVLQQKLDQYASIAMSMVNSTDKSIVLNAVSEYPEGSSPPTFTTLPDGQPQVQIPSKAAAFFLAGVDAFLQGNKLVAGWAFLEAARRNPNEPSFLNNVAFILLDYKLFNEARMILECALSSKPNYTSANVNIGFALGNLGDHTNAAKHYLSAVLNNPGNADYLYLSANEYAKAGAPGLAKLLAVMGSNITSTYDFAALINALPEPNPPITCADPAPTPSGNSAYWLFLMSIWPDTQLKDYLTPLQEYATKVLNPRLNNAPYTKQTCESSRKDELRNCRNACLGEPLCLAKCNCKFETAIEQCELTRAISVHGAYLSQAGYWNGLLNAWFAIEQNLLSELQPQMEGNWQQVLACHVAEYDRGQTEAFWVTSGTNIGTSEWLLDTARQNVNQTINFYCNKSIAIWLFTGGPTAGLEPKWCLGPLCFSYDLATQTVGVEAAFLLAGKLTKNLITGKWGVNVGVGMQLGAGTFVVGGKLYFTGEKGKVGIKSTVTYGPAEAGVDFSMERLSVPVGPYTQ